MDVIEARQLITLDTAKRLAGMPERTFHRRLKQHNVAIFIDPLDRRRRLVDASDVRRLVQRAERSGEPSAA